MAFIRKKKIRGKDYSYLVESYREDGKVKQRVLAYLPQSPRAKPQNKGETYDDQIMDSNFNSIEDAIEWFRSEYSLAQILTISHDPDQKALGRRRCERLAGLISQLEASKKK